MGGTRSSGRSRRRLTVGALMAAVAAMAVGMALVRSSSAPYRAATELLERSGRGPLLARYRASSAARVRPDRWQVRFVEVAGGGQRELVITLTDDEVRKARFLPW